MADGFIYLWLGGFHSIFYGLGRQWRREQNSGPGWPELDGNGLTGTALSRSGLNGTKKAKERQESDKDKGERESEVTKYKQYKERQTMDRSSYPSSILESQFITSWTNHVDVKRSGPFHAERRQFMPATLSASSQVRKQP